MKNKIHFVVILIVSVFCLYFWQELATAGGLGFIRNNIGWLSIIGLALLFSWRSFNQGNYSIPKFWLAGTLGCAIACIPFLIGNSEFIENSLWLPWGLLLSWFFLLSILNSESFLEHKSLLLLFIVMLCTAQVLIALWQLFHSYMMEVTSGITEHKLPQVKGTFNQRNLFASFIATGLISAIYIFPIKKTVNIGNYIISAGRQNGLLLLFILLGSFTLIFTDSRVGIYAFIVCLVLLAIGFRNSWRNKLIKPTVLVIIAVILSQLVISTIYDNKVKDFSRTTNRQVIYYTSIEAIKDAPVFGHGLGSFEKVYLEKLSELAKGGKFESSDLKGRAENLSHPHNELLYWGIQGGLMSIIGLLIMVFSVLSVFRHTSLNEALTYIALLFPISFHLMVELPFYISIAHLIVFGLLMAYVITSIGNYKTYNYDMKQKYIPQAITGLIAGVLILALTLNIYSLFKAVKFERALNPDLKDLDKVMLTIGWEDTYQSLRLRHEANRAAKLGVLEPQMDYLKWLEQQVEISPRLNYYFNLYAVNQYLGNSAEAQFYYNEIKRLFTGVQEAENWLEAHQYRES